MIKLQECQKKPSALSVFSGRASLSFLVSLPLLRGTGVGAFGSSKGRDGWDALLSRCWSHAGTGGTPRVAQHQDAPPSHPQGGTLLLARCVILEGFPSIPGIDPVGRSVTVLLGLWQREHRGKKHTMRRMEGGVWRGVWGGSHASQTSSAPWGRLGLAGDALGGDGPERGKAGRGRQDRAGKG